MSPAASATAYAAAACFTCTHTVLWALDGAILAPALEGLATVLFLAIVWCRVLAAQQQADYHATMRTVDTMRRALEAGQDRRDEQDPR